MPQTTTDHQMRSTTRVPPGLLLSATGWFTVGTAATVAGLATDRSSHAGTGLVGADVVSSTVADSPSTVLVAAAVVVWLLGAALVVGGLGWSVYPLTLAGVGLVVTLALAGSTAAIAAMAGLVLGTAPLAGRSTYAYITGGDH